MCLFVTTMSYGYNYEANNFLKSKGKYDEKTVTTGVHNHTAP